MSAIKWLLRLTLLLALLFVGVGFLLPDVSRVQRDITIARPTPEVFATLNSFRRFNDWSPWFPRDPQAEYAFEGPPSGVGATLRWASEKRDVGRGSQRIVASDPERRIDVVLAFDDQGEAQAAYVLEPVDGGTRVRWEFETRHGNNVLSRWFGLGFDRWIGADYENGLTKLKAMLESDPEQPPPAPEAQPQAGDEAA